jgi:hypothetical protein
MEPFSMLSLGLGALNAGLDISGGFDKAKRIRAETGETVRRFMLDAQRKMSSTEALGNASGVEGDSTSLTKYLMDMGNEFRKQADWMKSSGEYMAGSAETSGMNQAIGDIGGSLFSFGQSNNWFKPAPVK